MKTDQSCNESTFSDYASDEASNSPDSGRASPEPESAHKEISILNANDDPEDLYLTDEWTLSYREKASKGNKNWTFGDNEQVVATVSTMIGFWQVLNHVKTPTRIQKRNNPNMMFFRKGIKPQWEDEANQEGGMWLLTIKTGKYAEGLPVEGVLDKLWFESLIACVSEELEYSEYINGIIVQKRQREDRLQIWTKRANHDINTTIGKQLKALFQHSCPHFNIELTYTSHGEMEQICTSRATSIQKAKSYDHRNTKSLSMHCDRNNSNDSGAETTPNETVILRKDVSFGRRMSHVGKISIR